MLLGGHPFPLGAHPEGGGVRFAVASAPAEAVEVCLIDGDGSERRIELPERTFGVHHGVVPGITPGQRYGYRVHGPYAPERGLRCNPAKLLTDPFARRLTGEFTNLDAALGYRGDPMSGERSTIDSISSVPLSVVTSPGGPDTGVKPQVPFEETVIYELHVRGFTMRHPDVPEHQRGTYLGLAHPAVIEYLSALGVTAVELLPVHAFVDEPPLLRTHRRNYWGYASLGFFAPDARYASQPGKEVAEFRTMVSALHAAGIEVVLDVVFNHTAEGGADGPTLSFRGLDDSAYYVHDERGRYRDITGVGNTLDSGSPTVVRMVTDSLRYWAGDMGVDGFRFDLASVLGRPRAGQFDADAALLTAIACDPLLASTKLIAEPWDASGDGYAVGEFGQQWACWNDQFRDGVRDFWRGADDVRDLAYRLSGSSDLYARNGRRPWASINFVTAHDGFTLRDLVSYNGKHNDDNGEHGEDGASDNRSWNCGVEGDTSEQSILDLRLRQARNLMATVLLATGTPMITAGDERWRTQHGNNNPYCLDNETSWLDWTACDAGEQMLGFARALVALRASSPALRQPEFFEGRQAPSGELDLVWFTEHGEPMTEEDWFDGARRTLAMWIDGSRCRSRARSGEQVGDDSWLLVLHGGAKDTELVLPAAEYGKRYLPAVDTSSPVVPDPDTTLDPGATIGLTARSLLLLRAQR
ncbi:MAG: glycogen debranching protein GlgX [Sciscionella sp.]